ncbi:MAG: histone [Candidatus Woesearchaeota archaeon]
MPKPGKIIPLVPLKRLIQEEHNIRISKDALEILSDNLEKYALEISKKAIFVAANSGRKTVKGKDIKTVDKIN